MSNNQPLHSIKIKLESDSIQDLPDDFNAGMSSFMSAKSEPDESRPNDTFNQTRGSVFKASNRTSVSSNESN